MEQEAEAGGAWVLGQNGLQLVPGKPDETPFQSKQSQDWSKTFSSQFVVIKVEFFKLHRKYLQNYFNYQKQ